MPVKEIAPEHLPVWIKKELPVPAAPSVAGTVAAVVTITVESLQSARIEPENFYKPISNIL